MINKNKILVFFSVLAIPILIFAFSNIRISSAFDGPTDSAGVGSGTFAVNATGSVSIATTTFSASKLRVAGSIQSTTGGFVFPEGRTQTPAATGGGVTSTPAGYVTPGIFNSVAGTGGNYEFPASIVLSSTTCSSAGVIYKDANRFIHNYSPSGNTGANTFIGVDSGNFTMTGSWNTTVGQGALNQNTTGGYNTAVGKRALNSNTTGDYNTGLGYYALTQSATGTDNTAVGYYALNDNTRGRWNTANGGLALYSNTTGYKSTAVGYNSLFSNTTGVQNTALGEYSLRFNTTGNYNVGIGNAALAHNATGSQNVAIGNGAGWDEAGTMSNMNANTFLGAAAISTVDNISNSTAIGYGAQVTKSNQVVIGDGNVTETFLNGVVKTDAAASTADRSTLCISGASNGTVTSDAASNNCDTSSKRFKHDIEYLDFDGLDTLLALKPTGYIRNNPEKQRPDGRQEWGLIAEDVAAVDPHLVLFEPDGITPLGLEDSAFRALFVNAIRSEEHTSELQ